jgi:YidC/Oxa1 family membrane protein insertase
MSNGTKKQIDWVKYAGLAAAVASFLLFKTLWEDSQRVNLERQKAQLAQLEAEQKKREAEQPKPKDEPVEKTGELKADPSLVAVAKDSAKSGDGPPPPPAGDPGKTAPPTLEPEKDPADIQVESSLLKLTFSARGAGISSGWLADEFVTAKARAGNRPGLELLGRINPEQITLGMPYARFGTLEFEGLEKRVWFLEENSQSFQGAEAVWTVAYSTTLYQTAAPFKPQCKIVKRFKIGQAARHVETSVEVVNLTEESRQFQYSLRGAAGILMDGPAEDPTQNTSAYILVKSMLAGRREGADIPDVVIVTADSVGKMAEDKRMMGATGGNLWATVSNRFFMIALVARNPDQIVKISAEPLTSRTDLGNDQRYRMPNQSVVFRSGPTRELAASGKLADGFCLFMGPMKEDRLAQYEKELALPQPVHLDLAVQFCDIFGWRWPNIDRLSWLMMGIFRFIGSFSGYGIAVILLTLVIKLALHPFQRKMNISMHKMQMLQPKLKAIEEKFAGQTKPEMKQKKEMEKWDLMKKEGANPVSGCLPMFFQMPIFFALYGVFSRAFDIRQASFLWIQDLSLSDRLTTFSFWPHQLNLLPVIYIGFSIFQSLRAPKPENADPQQEMNRKMMMFMPVMFGFLFYSMPAGLVLYFAASSIFGFIESWYIKRFVLKVDRHGKPLSGSVPEEKNATIKQTPAKASA